MNATTDITLTTGWDWSQTDWTVPIYGGGSPLVQTGDATAEAALLAAALLLIAVAGMLAALAAREEASC